MSSNLTPIEIHQCVFGYDDGHRLLAASKQIHPADSARLLLASDLAPGLSSIDGLEYWTGIPLWEEQHYALLRTWAAPEISRPGCVWTHVLRIPFAEMARISSLGILRGFARRPILGEPPDAYKVPIGLVPEVVLPVSFLNGGEARDAAFALIHSVYTGLRVAPILHTPNIEEALFAIWSQQWPRLRRHFSFRTAVGPHGSPRELRFNLQILAPTLPAAKKDFVPSDWEALAVSDLFAEQPTELRLFLWRYGSDIRGIFEGFKVLTQLFIETRVNRLEGDRLRRVLLTVATAFPEASDGRLVKTDLIALSKNQYSRIPEIDWLEAWEFLMEESAFEHWPAPISPDTDLLIRELNSRPEVVTKIAAKTISNPSLAAQYFLSTFTSALVPDSFWEVTADSTELMHAVAATRPELLDHENLCRLAPSSLLTMLALCSFDEKSARPIIGRLLRVNNAAVASLMWDRHSDIVIEAIIGDAATHRAADAWMTLISEHSERWVQADVLSRATELGAIGKIVEWLDPESPSILDADGQLWVSALRTTPASTDELGLLAFVLVIAIRTIGPDWEYLFERAFEPVYEGLMSRRIPRRIFDALVRTFPQVPSWDEWDSCYRLTLAVAKAYVDRSADEDKLAATISDKYLRRRFLRAVSKLRPGDVD